MKNKYLFTIVIANYNHGIFIEDAIKSVLNQSFKNYELFVVDAKSTDNSVEVIKKYECKIDWWVSEVDTGQSNAFNKGFSRANGKFLLWLNADDILLPNSLKKAADEIEKNKSVEWFVANTISFDVNGLITKCVNGPSWHRFLFKNAPITVYGPTSIFSKKIFDELGCFDESLNYCMDTDLWYRFKNAGYCFKRIHFYFWGLRVHEDSKTSHAFFGKKSTHFLEESKKIKIKNKIVFKKKNLLYQKIFKIINGNYFKSFLDTKKNMGKHISNL